MKPDHNWKAYLSTKRRNGTLLTYIIDLRYPDGARERPELDTTDPDTAKREFTRWKREDFPIIRAEWESENDAAASHGPNPKLAEVFDYYTEKYLPVRATKGTIQHHEQVLREFELHCRDKRVGRVQQLSRSIVDGYAAILMKDKRSPKTVHNKLSVIRACLNVAVDAEIIDQSPIRKWLMPKVGDADIEPLQPYELKRVLAIVREHEPSIANVVTWMAYTGMRTSDARDIRWNQVDLVRRIRTRTQKKTGRRRTITIGPEAIAVLKAEKRRNRPGPSGEIFTDRHGEPFTRNYILRAWKRALKKSDYPRAVRVHDLRHTFAYILINYTGCSLRSAQDALEHDSIKTTMRYCKAGPLDEHLARFDSIIAESTEKVVKFGPPRATRQKTAGK